MTWSHLPVDYRPAHEPRWTVPADVCGTCSDFEAGVLVPVSFCAAAREHAEREYAWMRGLAPRPPWIEDLDFGLALIPREGTDA